MPALAYTLTTWSCSRACRALKAECDLIRRALHEFQHLLCMRVVAHKHKILALVGLEHRQHIRQLARLHHHKDKIIIIIRRGKSVQWF